MNFLFSALLLVTNHVFAMELPVDEVLLSEYRSRVELPVLNQQEQELTLRQYKLVFDEMYSHRDLKIAFFQKPELDPAKGCCFVGWRNNSFAQPTESYQPAVAGSASIGTVATTIFLPADFCAGGDGFCFAGTF
jgi:hypothetical protein